jgi:hypothetical protein
MSAFSGLPLLPQKVFDDMVTEIIGSTPGITLEEAVTEALATFEEDFRPDSLFVYRSDEALKTKVKLDANLATVERCADDEESRVNCTFAFQGLRQTLTSTNPADKGAWRLVESRKLAHTLVKLLKVKEGEDDDTEKDGAMEDDDDDDEEDEEEDRILFHVSVLELLLFLAFSGASQFLSAETAFSLSQELMEVLIARFDSSMSELRVASKLVDLLAVLLSQSCNRDFFREAGVPVLSLCAKFHKKNAALNAKIEALTAAL